MKSLIDLFLTLDRAGPGTPQDVEWALQTAGIRPNAVILDAGCGVGADVGALQRAVPKGQVTALDAVPEFAAQVAQRHPGVRAMTGDMADPPSGPWDLIWSAGAVYTIGVARALQAWRPVLAPGGCGAFSDLRWTGDARPAPAVDFWAAEGVEVSDLPALNATIADSGWQIVGQRWLGPAAWRAYYEPLEAALAHCPDPDLVAAFSTEIACWRRCGDSYDYALTVVSPR